MTCLLSELSSAASGWQRVCDLFAFLPTRGLLQVRCTSRFARLPVSACSPVVHSCQLAWGFCVARHYLACFMVQRPVSIVVLPCMTWWTTEVCASRLNGLSPFGLCRFQAPASMIFPEQPRIDGPLLHASPSPIRHCLLGLRALEVVPLQATAQQCLAMRHRERI